MQPNNNHSWLILGPGRTGSKILVDSIVELYRLHDINLRCADPTEQIIKIAPGTVYHSHLMSDEHFGNTVTHFVLSIRDMVDCALSWTKQPHIGYYHLYNKTHADEISALSGRIPSFYLNPTDLLLSYSRIIMFYKLLELQNIEDMIIVDYDRLCANQSSFFSKVGYPGLLNTESMPVKNPGTNAEWFVNWDEISELIAKLERRPEAILLDKLTTGVNNCIIV